jgi:hypothetical protein
MSVLSQSLRNGYDATRSFANRHLLIARFLLIALRALHRPQAWSR